MVTECIKEREGEDKEVDKISHTVDCRTQGTNREGDCVQDSRVQGEKIQIKLQEVSKNQGGPCLLFSSVLIKFIQGQ